MPLERVGLTWRTFLEEIFWRTGVILEAKERYEEVVKQLERTQQRLRQQVRTTMKYQKLLAGLSTIYKLHSQLLEIEQLLQNAIALCQEVIEVEVVWIFFRDEETGELKLIAYDGVSAECAQELNRIKLDQGFIGQAAQTGEPLMVENATSDPRLWGEAVRKESLESQLIVPLKRGNEVIGTICVAMRSPREFLAEDLELLITIGNAICVALENARLHQEHLEIAERLLQSERDFRELFERAHDAIWVHDVEGNVIMFNEAATKLTGYSKEEACKMNVKTCLSGQGLSLAREVRRKLLQEEVVAQPYEQQLIKKNGEAASLMLTTNLIYDGDGQPQAFQNIARDVTEEKRLQENLRLYAQQVTRAQEEERKRIACELHDSTAQALIALLHQLENFSQSKASFPISDARFLWSLQEQIKSILQEVRGFTRELRPSILDDLGLLPSLNWLSGEMEKEYGIKTNLTVFGNKRDLAPEVELMLFRIVQEALRNIVKHAQASRAEIRVEFNENKTKVTITDNGIGFEVPRDLSDLSRSNKFGLLGMEERVQLLDGSLIAQSELGKGTTIIVEAPVWG